MEENAKTGDEQGQRIPPVMVGPHPLGGIGVTTRGPDGTQVVAHITLEEAALLVALTQSWITIMISEAMAAAEAQQVAARSVVLKR